MPFLFFWEKMGNMKKIIILCGLLLLTFFWGILELKYGSHTENRKKLITVLQQENMDQTGTGIQEDTETQKENVVQTALGSEREIRVLLKSDGYASEYHTDICLTSDGDYKIRNGENSSLCRAGEEIRITSQSDLFAKEDVLQVSSDGGMFYFPELGRAEEDIGYEGSLEVRKTDQGLLLVNVLSLEDYLCGVLPSEMSASFPTEALKAQAICARTYAIQQQESGRAKAYGADLDDSTSYQVYNNRCHGEETDQAVKETAGLVMMQDGVLADARYYSTSCGLDLHMDLSEDSVFAAFLQEDKKRSVEAEEPMYRWKTSIRLSDLQAKTEWKRIESLEITERDDRGAAVCLEVAGQKNTGRKSVCEKIEGEYQIRQFLALADPVITLQDESTREGWQLLPSAFILLNPVTEEEGLTGYEILGGGYGHGEGLSQNGAKHMAEQGENYEEILKNYYGAIEIVRYSS